MNETFVVRVWRPADPEEAEEQPLQGVVEHVSLPARRSFTGTDELVAVIQAILDRREREEPV